jgi:hypothetical protein
MNRLASPYLICGFYKRGMPPSILAQGLLQLLVAHGTVPNRGTVKSLDPGGFSEAGFTSPAQAVHWLSELQPNDSFELEIQSGGVKQKFGPELLGNWKDAPNARHTDVVSLFTGGSAFWMHGAGSEDQKGLAAYKRFLYLCEGVRPTYAAITVEWELESPQELNEDPRSYAFQDFLLGSDLSKEVHSQAESLYKGAFIQKVSAGTYISTCRSFNPRRIAIPSSYLTGDFARLLAKHLNVPRFDQGS